ncbi:MAG: hypothetical protein D6679_06785 [Candidatus Hydrogenedentota bacterium]|nr:MAG: hypothetical protein D6679_06785 [Candidatus Hydrogenedentota bacterium]
MAGLVPLIGLIATPPAAARGRGAKARTSYHSKAVRSAEPARGDQTAETKEDEFNLRPKLTPEELKEELDPDGDGVPDLEVELTREGRVQRCVADVDDDGRNDLVLEFPTPTSWRYSEDNDGDGEWDVVEESNVDPTTGVGHVIEEHVGKYRLEWEEVRGEFNSTGVLERDIDGDGSYDVTDVVPINRNLLQKSGGGRPSSSSGSSDPQKLLKRVRRDLFNCINEGEKGKDGEDYVPIEATKFWMRTSKPIQVLKTPNLPTCGVQRVPLRQIFLRQGSGCPADEQTLAHELLHFAFGSYKWYPGTKKEEDASKFGQIDPSDQVYGCAAYCFGKVGDGIQLEKNKYNCARCLQTSIDDPRCADEAEPNKSRLEMVCCDNWCYTAIGRPVHMQETDPTKCDAKCKAMSGGGMAGFDSRCHTGKEEYQILCAPVRCPQKQTNKKPHPKKTSNQKLRREKLHDPTFRR